MNPSLSALIPKDSSSVIQFVTRGSVQVNDGVMEVENGLSEDFSVSTDQRNPFYSRSVNLFNESEHCWGGCRLSSTCF